MANYQVKAATLFETFETIGDWTISGGTAAIDTSSSHVSVGTGSLALTSGVGTNCIATKTISADMSRAGVISFDIFIDDVSTVSSVQMIVSSDAAFAKFFTRTVAGTALRNGLNTIVIGRDVWGNTGGDAWENTMVRLRVRVNANASVTAVAYFDNMTYGKYNRPKVVFIFDDGFSTQYTAAYNYMKNYNMPGTAAIVSSYIDALAPTYMTTAQITEMHTAGWALVNHTNAHNRLDNFSTVADMVNEFYPCTQFLQSNGFTRNNEHLFFVYPNGGYNATAITALQSKNMIAARSILSESSLSTSMPVDNPYVLVTRNLGNTTTLASAKASVDTAIKNGGTLIFEGHKIVASPTADTEFLDTDFYLLVDYIQQYVSGGVLDVVNFPEWWRGLTNSRKLS